MCLYIYLHFANIYIVYLNIDILYIYNGTLFNEQFNEHRAGSGILSSSTLYIVHLADDMCFRHGVNSASKAQESFRHSLDCLRILQQRTFC